MATEARTLERLQYLAALYRQGYRSEVGIGRWQSWWRWNKRWLA